MNLVDTTLRAYAYVNFARWVADCPRPYCGNAIGLAPGQTQFHCYGTGGCQLITDVVWPSEAEEIWAVLEARPVPSTRNWAPAGHRQAIACHVPDGQTVADLRTETHEYDGPTQLVGFAVVRPEGR